MSWGWNFRYPGGKAECKRIPVRLNCAYLKFNWKPVMARQVEREQTNQVTVLIADEMEGVSGGLTFELVDVKIISFSVSGHDSSPVPTT
jgi:hypothetical protein